LNPGIHWFKAPRLWQDRSLPGLLRRCHVVLIAIALVAVQAASSQAPKAENPAETRSATSWTGCMVAGSTPGAFRLNLDEGTAVAGPADPVSLGDPFVQLVAGDKVDLSRYVGRHVVVQGKGLSQAEAERQAMSRPDQQEANATAAGTGGRVERHLKYVRVTSVKEAAGSCK